MIRRSLLAGIFLYCFSISTFSMHGMHGMPTGQATSIHQHLEVSKAYWPYVQAIWSVLLTGQKLHYGAVVHASTTEIINDCNAYLAVTFERTIDSVKGDTERFAQLLSRPEKILVKSLTQRTPAGAMTIYYVDENVMKSSFEVHFNDQQKGAWNPHAALMPNAIARGDMSTLGILLREGLDINHRFYVYNDRTMLHFAAKFGVVSIVNFLLSHHACVTLHDRNGYRPLDIALEKKHHYIAKILLEAEASHTRASQLVLPQQAVVAPPVQLEVLPPQWTMPTPYNEQPSYIYTQEQPPQASPYVSPLAYGAQNYLSPQETVAPLYKAPQIFQKSTTTSTNFKAPQIFQKSTTTSTNFTVMPKMYLNAKYLEGKVPQPINRISDADIEPVIPKPDLVFRNLGRTLGYRGERNVASRKFDGLMHYTVMSTAPFRPVDTYKRNTFVLAGRGHKAFVPDETDDEGRVILIAAPWQADEAVTWLGDHRDVVVIEALWDQFGNLIPQEELGLVTVRRMVAFHLARLYGMHNFMMLDDNIEHLYVSKSILPKPQTWADFYREFEMAAHDHKSTILSGRALDFQMLRHSLNAGDILVDKNEQASKMFFVNMDALSGFTREGLAWLFPLRRDVCGEDIFLQAALAHARHWVDAISTRSIAYWKNQTHRDAARNTITPAMYWENPDPVPATAPDYYRFASKRLQEIYFENVERIEKINEARRAANLPALTAENDRRLQKKRQRNSDKDAGHISDEIKVVNRKEPVRKEKRRKLTKKSLRGEGTRYINESSSLLALNFAETIEAVLSQHWKLKDPESGPFMKHQLKAILGLKDVLEQGKKRGFVELPTGAGKTRVFLMWLAMALRTPELKNKHMAILVPSLELVDQTYEAIKRFNEVMAVYGLSIPLAEAVSKISSGNVSQSYLPFNNDFHGSKGLVYVFCTKSFENLIATSTDYYDYFSMVIVDEFHTANDDTLLGLKDYSKRNEMLFFGFSATPKEKDFYFENSVYYMSVLKAVKRGVLCSWENRSLGEWDRKDQSNLNSLTASFNHERHTNGKLLKDTKSIIYVSSIEEAKLLAAHMRAAGIRAHSYTNENSKEEQQRLLQRFAQKDDGDLQINVLIAILMLNMGFDGNVDTTVIAKMVNYETAVQIRGRALRKDASQPLKKALFIAPQQMFDIYDLQAPGEEPGDDIPSFFAAQIPSQPMAPVAIPSFMPAGPHLLAPPQPMMFGPTHALDKNVPPYDSQFLFMPPQNPVLQRTPELGSPHLSVPFQASTPPLSPGQFRVTLELPPSSTPTHFTWTIETPQMGGGSGYSPYHGY